MSVKREEEEEEEEEKQKQGEFIDTDASEGLIWGSPLPNSNQQGNYLIG